MSQADIGCKNGDKTWWYYHGAYVTGTVVNDKLDGEGRIQVQTDSGKERMRVFPHELHMGKCPFPYFSRTS